MSIIKRKKQEKFFIMSNHAAQQDLISLSSIGLLAYIKSLPEDWTLYKTFLQKKFTRRTVDSAWKELVEKHYIAGFSCYVDRKKQYFYIVHDEKLTQDDFNEFVEEIIAEIKEEGFDAKNIKPIKDCLFTVVQNVQYSEEPEEITDVQYVQYSENSTTSTVPDEQIQIQINQDVLQIHTNKEISVNTTDEYKGIINTSFLEQGDGLFDKEDILYFTMKILEELTVQPEDPKYYFNSIVEHIVAKRKQKLNMTPVKEVPFYNWLQN